METTNKVSKKKDFIRTNRDIRESLMARISSLELMLKDVEADALLLGRTSIRISRLSAFFQDTHDGNHDPNCLTQDDIYWLADRYGVSITISASLKPNWKEESAIELIRRKYGKR